MARERPFPPAIRPFLYLLLFIFVFHNFWGHAIIYRDAFHLFAPLKKQIAEAWSRGEIWGWLPWQYLGMPFVGDAEAGWFYPLNAIYLLLPFEPAHRVFILIHYPLAAWFMDRLLRRLGGSAAIAFWGAMTFALSGYLVGMHSMVTMLIGPTWAPLAFYFLVRARAEGARWGLGVGVVVAMQILGGDPQAALITAAVASISFIWMVWPGAGAAAGAASSLRLRALVSLAIAGFGALFLSAAQFLPSLELTLANSRRGGLPFGEVTVYSMHPARLLELLWPTPFGVNWPDYNYWARFAQDFVEYFNPPWTISNYLGLPAIALAVWGVAAGGGRRRVWIAAGLILFLTLAIGRYFPLFKALHKWLPIFDMFRYPEKYMGWFTGLAVVVASIGLEAIARFARERPSAAARVAVAYLGGSVGAWLLGGWGWPRWMAATLGVGPGSAHYESALVQLRLGGLEFLGVNLGVGAVLLLLARGRISRGAAFIVFCLLTLFDLRRTNVAIMPLGPPEVYTARSILAEAIHPGGPPPLGVFRELRTEVSYLDRHSPPGAPSNFAALKRWERDTLGLNLDTFEGFEDLIGFNAARPVEGLVVLQRAMDAIKKESDPRLLELYNVRYLITPRGGDLAIGDRGRMVFRDAGLGVTVTELVQAMPRSFFAPAAVRAKEGKEELEQLAKIDPRREVTIAGLTDEPPGPAAEAGEGRTRMVEYTPDRVRLTVEAPAAGWVVLNDRFFPGWTATVDGAPTEIYKANGFVRATRVAAGEHTIVYAYRPWPLRVGGWISAISWLGLVAGMAVWAGRCFRRGLRSSRTDIPVCPSRS